MLATDQSKKSKPFESARSPSGNPGSNGTHTGGRTAASATGKTWFVLRKGTRDGPYNFAALVNMAKEGLVEPDAGVWCLGWAEWRIARNVPGLFELKPEPDDLADDVEAREDGADDREEPHRGRETAEKAVTAAPPLAPLDLSASPMPAPPLESKRVRRGGGARLALFCVLAVLMVVFGAGWAAISLDIIRVEFLPNGFALLKQVEGMLAVACAVH